MSRRKKKNGEAIGDALPPAGRTATQAVGPASVVVLLAAFDLIHWNEQQTAAVMTIATAAWAFVQNWWENRTGHDFLIRKKR